MTDTANPAPDLEAARRFLGAHHHAVLATLRGDGSPQMSPVTVGVDGAGRAIISSRETAYKVRNLRRRPRVWLCVFTEAFYGGWLQLSGNASVVSMPDALELLVDYYRDISGEHPDWAEYRRVMVDDRRVLIRIDIDTVGPSRSG